MVDNDESNLHEFVRLTVGIVWEINKPLTSVLGHAKLLLMEHKGEIASDAINRETSLQAIVIGAEHITEYIHELLTTAESLLKQQSSEDKE